ncbi:death-on-curing family protein [Catonella morbi ATCC 51271]|uniref:Death-on-curing family protein n=1 Tax=Catonella morbi ATCC 51271 TaxID=592026 RepID=V2Z8N5_9FIRM|nr:Fic family protein [Catonella morbi]ESL03290.1 death-on-curing family protein [Catonella morbi ATCC 51271]
MVKVTLNNEILKYITEIDKNRYKLSAVKLTRTVVNKLRKNSKKKSSYASTKIEGNPLSQKQVDEVIENDERKHYLKPEQEVRNYFLALNYLEEKAKKKEKFSIKLILDVQKFVEKGASKEKIGLRGQMPPGILFAVYDSQSDNSDYIPPEYVDIPELLEELADYVNTTDDHPLIVAAVVHYQLVTIHPFEDGNGRTARLLSGYILDINGYGFNGVGSLEEYFAYDVEEYYDSIQMGLPALYYSGRDNPPHPELWINYFLRMVLLYSSKVCELSESESGEELDGSLSYLKSKEKELLLFLIKSYKREFTPIEVSKEFGVTNKTIINRLSTLVKNGFVVPIVVKERIRSYKLSDFTRENEGEIKNRETKRNGMYLNSV